MLMHAANTMTQAVRLSFVGGLVLAQAIGTVLKRSTLLLRLYVVYTSVSSYLYQIRQIHYGWLGKT